MASPSSNRLQKLKAFGTALCLAAACMVAYVIGTGFAESPHEAQLSAKGLTVDSSALSLGDIWETPTYTAILPLKNTSDKTIEVLDFASSCDCTSVEPRSFSLDSGATIDLRLKIDLTHRPPYQVGLPSRPISVSFAPVFPGGTAPGTSWELTANIMSRVNLDASHLDFLAMCSHSGPPASRTIHAEACMPVSGLRIDPADPAIVVDVRAVANSARKFDLVVTPSPKIAPGRFFFKFRVMAEALDGMSYPCASVTVVGEMQPLVRVIPAVVLFGERKLGETVESEVSLQFPANGWSVDRAETSVTGIRLDPIKPGSPRSASYHVTQCVGREKDQSATIVFHIRGPGGQIDRAEVELKYYGLQK